MLRQVGFNLLDENDPVDERWCPQPDGLRWAWATATEVKDIAAVERSPGKWNVESGVLIHIMLQLFLWMTLGIHLVAEG